MKKLYIYSRRSKYIFKSAIVCSDLSVNEALRLSKLLDNMVYSNPLMAKFYFIDNVTTSTKSISVLNSHNWIIVTEIEGNNIMRQKRQTKNIIKELVHEIEGKQTQDITSYLSEYCEGQIINCSPCEKKQNCLLNVCSRLLN